MKYIFLVFTTSFLMISCAGENQKTLNPDFIKLSQINSIEYGGFSGLKDIELYNGAFYTIARDQSKIVKIQDGKIQSVSPGSGNKLGEFQSLSENLVIANGMVYVLERSSRFINRYSLDLKPIDRVELPSKFPKGRSLNIVRDSLLIVTSLITDMSRLNMYNITLEHIKALKLNQEVGHALWDIKYMSVVNDKIIVGYPFSGRVEILSYKGDLLNYFDTGTKMLNIQIPDFKKNEVNQDINIETAPTGVNFLSIQALNENCIMFFTPENKKGIHEIYFVDLEGEVIGKSSLKGSFQYIHALNGNIYGYNQATDMIEVFEVLM